MKVLLASTVTICHFQLDVSFVVYIFCLHCMSPRRFVICLSVVCFCFVSLSTFLACSIFLLMFMICAVLTVQACLVSLSELLWYVSLRFGRVVRCSTSISMDFNVDAIFGVDVSYDTLGNVYMITICSFPCTRGKSYTCMSLSSCRLGHWTGRRVADLSVLRPVFQW